MDLFLFCVCLCYIVLSVSCCLVVTCWERADFLALLYVIFPCVFVTFPYGILGRMCYLIVDCIDSRSLPSSLLCNMTKLDLPRPGLLPLLSPLVSVCSY